MNFLCVVIDANVDARIGKALQKEGYNIYSLSDHQACADDIKIMEVAAIKEAYIITEDKEFGKVISYKKNFHRGTLLLQFAGLTIAQKNSAVFNALLNHGDELIDSFSVLTSEKLTIRKYFS